MSDSGSPSGSIGSDAGSAPPATGSSERYRLQTAGSGLDTALDRSVRIRTVDAASADHLAAEARFLARLDHQSLPHVHDFVRDHTGASLIERPTPGDSLDQAMAKAHAGHVVPALSTPATCALIVMRVCDALAAAHARGVVHRHLNPACILLGEHGQVTVGGWEKAWLASTRSTAVSATGLALDGQRDDIQAVGICLYGALVHQSPPLDSSGQLGVVSADILATVPPTLMAIIRRAMSTSAADGYASIVELHTDLGSFLDARSPKAVGHGVFRRTSHWLYHNRGPLTALAGIFAVAIGALLWFQWTAVRNLATWGPAVVNEDFESPSWSTRWDTGTIGAWELVKGRVVTSGNYDSYLIYRQRLATPLAIEYTAQMLPQAKLGDLSVWWCEGDPLNAARAGKPWSMPGYFIQAGAYENSCSALFRSPSGARCANANLRLSQGQDHRIRVEIENGRIRQWIDGKLTLDYTDIFPSPSGYIALYGYHAGKSFDDIRIWQRNIPTLVSPLAIGDAIYQQGRFAEAAEAFARVADAHSASTLGQQARFRQGLALEKAGEPRQSKIIRDLIQTEDLRQRAQCLDIDDLAEAGNWPDAAKTFDDYWRNRPGARDELRQRWQAGAEKLQKLPAARNGAPIESWIALRHQHFPTDESTAWIAADLMLSQQRFTDVLTEFPKEHRAMSWALLGLGRADEVLKSDWAISHERIMAYVATGRFDEALASPAIHPDMRAVILCAQGRFAESLEISPYPAGVFTGMDPAHLGSGDRVNAGLIAAGRIVEAAGEGLPTIPGSGKDGLAMILLGQFDAAAAIGADVGYFRFFAQLAAGEEAEARLLRPTITGNRDGRGVDQWFGAAIGLPLADEALGTAGALRAAMEQGRNQTGAWGGRLARIATAVLNRDDHTSISDMPQKVEIKAWTLVTEALRAEVEGDRPAALKAWTAYRGLPVTQRLVVGGRPDPELEWCCTWRLAALAKAP